jgi:hypothetical protein
VIDLEQDAECGTVAVTIQDQGVSLCEDEVRGEEMPALSNEALFDGLRDRMRGFRMIRQGVVG